MRYGIEIEAEEVHEPFEVMNGRYEHDGSLRNDGIEYISEILDSPKEAKYWHDEVIQELCNIGADFSPRCGVHIHVDMRDHSLTEIKQFLKNYLIMERRIFKIVGHNRDHNTFCLPMLDSDGDFTSLKRYLHTGRLSYLSNTSKYIALNFIPLLMQGSLEFRMLQTTEMVSNFNQVVDIIEDINTLTSEELLNKYDISAVDMLEAEAYYTNLTTETPRQESMEFLSTHFPTQEQQEVELTEEMIINYIQRNF